MIDADMRCAHGALEARLRAFVARRVAAPADVDDVVQTVFLRMQRGLPDLREESHFGPWIYQVARSALADERRARARHPLVEEGDRGGEELVAEADEPGDDVEAMLARCVVPFIAALPSPYREALTLTEIEGLTQREAAAMLGVSLSGMKSRVQRGREKLRDAFEQCCEIALDARGRVIGFEPRARGGCAPACDGGAGAEKGCKG